MLVFGMPFYGRGNNKEFPINYDFNEKGYSKEYTEQWDDVAKVPYLVDKNGKMVNPRGTAKAETAQKTTTIDFSDTAA